MLKKCSLNLLIGTVTTLTLLNISVLKAESIKNVYILPNEAECTIRKNDKLTYCTDQEGAPITGELRRYQNNRLFRLYPLENGILEGTAVTYYKNGKLRSEKPYKQGKLNGIATSYYDTGAIEEETPYVNGLKEGIGKTYDKDGFMTSQMIYRDDALNGEMRIYTKTGHTHYVFENNNNKLTSGTYYYRLSKTNRIDMTDLPPLIIEALNRGCLELQKEMTSSACAVVFNGPLEACDETWRKQNRAAVRKYLAECERGKV